MATFPWSTQVCRGADPVVQPVCRTAHDRREEDEDERNGNLRFARYFATAFLGEALHVHHDDGHVVVAAGGDCFVYQL